MRRAASTAPTSTPAIPCCTTRRSRSATAAPRSSPSSDSCRPAAGTSAGAPRRTPIHRTRLTPPAPDMTKESSDHPPKFVIVTLPRSGSYNLVSLLNSAPDIVCHGEIFKRDAVEVRPLHLEKMGFKTEDVAERDAKPGAFLQRLRGLNARKIVGFKMFPE